MEICTVDGFEQVGKNMTAVKIGEDVFLFDAGFDIPSLIRMQEAERVPVYSERNLRRFKAIPNDLVLDKLGWREKVRAIIISHAHLDHVGALPFIFSRYKKAVILATPFTMAVAESIARDERRKAFFQSKRVVIRGKPIYELKGKSGRYKIQFIHTTHSTLQCSFIALHSREGIFFYALDFKMDRTPILEDPPDYEALKLVGRKGVKVLVVDALYSGNNEHTPSESVARSLLQSAMASVKDHDSAFFIATFSSHIARLKSIIDFSKQTGRKVVFLGRSLHKYASCAERIGVYPFNSRVAMPKYGSQVNSMLKKIERDRGKYLVVCTGHQAEEGSILDRIVRGMTPFKFRKGDHLIFSSKVIPVKENIEARKKMDTALRRMGVVIQDNVHVSGHASAKDILELFQLVKPENVIPSHGTIRQLRPLLSLARRFGIKRVSLSRNGKLLKF